MGQKLKIPIYPRKLNRATLLASSLTENVSGQKVTYRVRKGDTLWGIGKKMGVRSRQIQAWNNLRASGHIHPGDRLTIYRSSLAVDTGGAHYRVRRGDTLWEIARAFDTSVGQLKQWNGIQNATSLRAGSRLRVRPASAHVE